KRTKLLRNNQVDPQGTLYLGDGCWGREARTLDNTVPRWYHEKVGSIQHFWIVDVSRSGVKYRAMNKDGKIFDVYPPDAAGAEAAEKVFLSLTQPVSAPPGTPASK